MTKTIESLTPQELVDAFKQNREKCLVIRKRLQSLGYMPQREVGGIWVACRGALLAPVRFVKQSLEILS